MNVAQERTKSLWMGTPIADAPPLAGEHSADVVIIGSGIAGLSTAYELMSRGRSVMVIDRGAIGTHMGCVVHWNSLEQCWDCPCHGSQFAPDGTPLNGPAVAPLAEVQQKERLVAAE